MHRRRGYSSRFQTRGVVLVLAMIVVVTIVVLAIVFVNAQSSTIGILQNINDHARARGIAESALMMTIAEVRRNPDWRTDFTHGAWASDQALDGGTYTILGQDGRDSDGDGILETDGDLADSIRDFLTLTATGRFNGVSHTVQALIYPPKNVLMIVPDVSSLTDEDLIREELIASWGWQVSMLSEDASAAEFDAAVADTHVIYFPAHTDLTGDVHNRLKDEKFDIPIVTAHEKLSKELKLCGSDSKNYDGKSIDIQELTQTTTDEFGVETTIVVTHYITEPFPIGSLAIASKNEKLLRMDGTIAPGIEALAVKVGETTRVVLGAVDSGGLNKDKKPLRARRASLPWGGRGAFSITSLNEDGLTVLRRSLDWGGAGWIGFLPGIAAWDKVQMDRDTVVDGFDSTVGPYGDTNHNQDATVSTISLKDNSIDVHGYIGGSVYVGPNANMAKVINIHSDGTLTGSKRRLRINTPALNPREPIDLGSSTGDRTFAAGTTVVSSNLHVNKLTLSGNAIVYIIGNVAILCQNDVKITDNAQLRLGGNIGSNSVGTNVEDLNVPDWQIGTQVYMPERGTVTSIQANVKGPAGAQIRYALYREVGGNPQQLVVESAVETVTDTAYYWHSIDIAPTVLDAGTYWLAVSYQTGVKVRRDKTAATGQSRQKNHNAVALGFANSWAVSDASDTQNIYIGATYTPENGPSTLTIYTKEDCWVERTARVNINTGDPTKMNWLMLKKKVEVTDDAQLCAAAQAFDGELKVKKDAHFYGTFIGKKVKLEDRGQIHVDIGSSGSVVTLGGGLELQEISTRFYRWLER